MERSAFGVRADLHLLAGGTVRVLADSNEAWRSPGTKSSPYVGNDFVTRSCRRIAESKI